MSKSSKPTGKGNLPLPVRVEADPCSEMHTWYLVLDAENQIVGRYLYEDRAENIAWRLNRI